MATTTQRVCTTMVSIAVVLTLTACGTPLADSADQASETTREKAPSIAEIASIEGERLPAPSPRAEAWIAGYYYDEAGAVVARLYFDAPADLAPSNLLTVSGASMADQPSDYTKEEIAFLEEALGELRSEGSGPCSGYYDAQRDVFVIESGLDQQVLTEVLGDARYQLNPKSTGSLSIVNASS